MSNSDASVMNEAARRRTFAVISHPDAGKSTLTEALALHAHVISEAGAVHGKRGRRGVASDWMAMERERGISVTSAVLQFEYRDCVLNLLDTPGHADFSEDTYRVLAAVDCAVMLLDAAKGLEPQTLKLFGVCRTRGIPVITFVNKWDRPGREALELLDEIEHRLGIRATPVMWPVGVAGHFEGLMDRRDPGFVTRYSRTAGGATRAGEQRLPITRSLEQEMTGLLSSIEEVELLQQLSLDHEQEAFLAGFSTPVFFGAAVSNIGVRSLLEALIDLAPAPVGRFTEDGGEVPLDDEFTGLVFKVQANMDPAHRDKIAFVRVCSGIFERGMMLAHAGTGRPFTTKYAHSMLGRERTSVDRAFPGDIVGLVNAASLHPGDTLTEGKAVRFPPMPVFAPEHFAVVRGTDPSKSKQFRKGVAQLEAEGVVQVLMSDRRSGQAPVFGAVGPMQFEVATHRLQHEFGAPASIEMLPYTLARRTNRAGLELLGSTHGVEVLQRMRDGAFLALFSDRHRLAFVARQHPGLMLDLLAAQQE